MRIDEALREARLRLAASPTPALDAELLLGHLLGRSRSDFYTWPERRLDAPQLDAFRSLVARRVTGWPVAYLIGEREFFGRRFRVTGDTLIPRPDTETLIEAALETAPATPRRVVDLGAGSGAIGITLALERPAWSVTLVDNSAAALAVAGDNARRLGAKVVCAAGSWLDAVAGEFDLIVANPPYIDSRDRHLEQGDLRFEPRHALVAAEHGLADLRAIASQGRARLAAGGWLLLEHGFDQGEPVRSLLRNQGFQSVLTRRDLAGNDRVTLGHV
jgi:release factor glutamine methyltransferase